MLLDHRSALARARRRAPPRP